MKYREVFVGPWRMQFEIRGHVVFIVAVLDGRRDLACLMSRNGASHQILRGIALDVVDFAVSVPLFLEYEDVLKRPSLVRQTGLSAKDIDMVLDLLAANGHQTLLDFMWRPQLRDADDEMVLEAATNGGAAAIVTFNQRDFLPAATTFGLRVITPGDYLPSIKGKLP